MRTHTSLLLFTILLAAAPVTSGQTPGAPHAPNNPLPQWVYDRARPDWRRPDARSIGVGNIDPRGKNFPGRSADIEVLEARAAFGKMLMPPASYFEKYKRFLKKGKNGIFRIFPDKGCDKGLTISAEELGKCADSIPIKGSGSLFSFRFQSHLGFGRDPWDLHLIDGKFIAGNDSVEALIAEIVDADIIDVDLNTVPFREFAAYKPKRSTSAIRAQNVRLAAGDTIDGHTFTSTAAAKLDSVYAMRIVAYHVPAKSNGIMGKTRFPGRGVDIRLAFKVVGQENDGSLVIIWTELKRNIPTRELTD